jgi:hypothetical protein
MTNVEKKNNNIALIILAKIFLFYYIYIKTKKQILNENGKERNFIYFTYAKQIFKSFGLFNTFRLISLFLSGNTWERGPLLLYTILTMTVYQPKKYSEKSKTFVSWRVWISSRIPRICAT